MDLLTTVPATYFALVGAGLIALGVGVLRRSLRLLTRGARVRGTVVGWVEKRPMTDETGPTDHPRIRYGHPSGRIAEFTSEFSGSPRRLPIGSLVTVSVIGDGPRDAEMSRPPMLLAGPAALFLLGGVTVYAGLDGWGWL